MGKAETDTELISEKTAMAAHHFRNRLAEAVDIVPFVDPVVVSTHTDSNHSCAIVELDLLESFLCHGPEVITEGELQLLRHHVPAVVTSIEVDGSFS